MIVHLALESRMMRSVQRRLPGPLRHSSDLLLNLGGYSIRVFSQTSTDSGADSIQTTLTYKMEPNWQTCSFDIVNRTIQIDRNGSNCGETNCAEWEAPNEQQQQRMRILFLTFDGPKNSNLEPVAIYRSLAECPSNLLFAHL
ncbi:hypothetical protein Mp_1g22160 [Marchantia polymorpha subsp. ruderalis]|uniref:Uncharacterized protein n=2 Tax=Marchantia polymorpha TaxID=3197 RepID=A0AAF6AT09_MARPO|nr:hypothetical protein MARPO_0001s0554 [Marchantia polymorpha]BBM99579.1 hypothetical protein Mp_1g22160 [Marchantia polymorpha subsp. ruderalis]|eukprot:PTQ50667.1 hypothetical protein MARPO_0001s0554 [Marchantia polymorpha]